MEKTICGLKTFALSLLLAASAFLLTSFSCNAEAVAQRAASPGGLSECAAESRSRSSAFVPWDVRIKVKCGVKNWDYVLSEQTDGLDEAELTSRLIFNSVRAKKRWVAQAVEMGFDEIEAWCFLLPNFNNIAKECEKMLYVEAKDAQMTFKPETAKRFIYTKEKIGSELDRKSFAEALARAAETGGVAEAKAKKVMPNITEAALRNQTGLKCRFSTWYGNSSDGRKSNVKRALRSFNGMVVENGEEVSFNETVGARTKENGFFEARIIVNGKYVPGVGGGVCQASTTLFNALILSGVTVNKVHQHSLVSSYVMPSFDAMVSSVSDLVFTNETGGNLYFVAFGTGSEAIVEIYGMPNEFEIKRRSVEIKRIPFSTRVIEDKDGKYSDKVVFDTDTYVIARGVDGLETEGWLDYYVNGKKVKSKRIRQNKYLPTEQVVVKGIKKPAETESETENKSGASGS